MPPKPTKDRETTMHKELVNYLEFSLMVVTHIVREFLFDYPLEILKSSSMNYLTNLFQIR